MRRAAIIMVLLSIALSTSGPARAHEQHGCSRVVVYTLPGITWTDVARWDPPELTALTETGALGSVSVRTVTSKTNFASAFATLGAGNRLDGGAIAGGPRAEQGDVEHPGFAREVEVAGLEELKELALEADYGAVPGALGTALGSIPAQAVGNADLGVPPPAPGGYGRWSLLAAMDVTGTVDRAATSALLLKGDPAAPYGVRTDPVAFGTVLEQALSQTCALTVIDHGDLTRADRLSEALGVELSEERREALLAADEMLGRVVEALDFDKDLLLVLAPTSPASQEATHFGIAVAVGERFPAGTWLESPSTRRDGLVTLVDVAPAVLEHLHRDRAASMTGRAWFSTPAGDVDRITTAIDLDEESVFVDRMRTPVVTGFVIFQIAVYVLIAFLFLRERDMSGRRRRRLFSLLEMGALAVVAFPVATYLAGIGDSHELGEARFVAVLIAIDVLLLAAVRLLLREPMDRLLALTAATVVVLMVDLLVGAPLQLNTVLSYSPIVAGRFSGIGNIAFAVLAGATLMTGTLIVQRWPSRRWALIATALLFTAAIVVDGAPAYGSDVGGIITLIPALGMTLVLLAERRPRWTFLIGSIVALIVALAVFVAVDLARPEESRTHLARLFEDVRDGGFRTFVDVIERKVRTNLRVFTTTIWTYAVPPALLAMTYLLLRPRGRWQRLAATYPKLRGGLEGGLILAAVGFAVNDSGIVIPAVILSFLVPIALLIHMHLESQPADRGP